MATPTPSWFLIARNPDNKPNISAMSRTGAVVESLTTTVKADLIRFLQRFTGASGFLVAAPTAIATPSSTEPIEATDLLPQDEEEDGMAEFAIPTAVPTPPSWFDFFRDTRGQPVVVAMAGNRAVDIFRGNQKANLITFLNKYPTASYFLVAPAGKPIPSVQPPVVRPEVPIRARGVLLEIGHGPGTPFDPGAIAPTGETEYNLNILTANAARDVIRAARVPCLVINPAQGSDRGASLREIGTRAAGYDIFCSIHHNSFNRQVQGTEVLIHRTKGSASSRRLAEVTARAIAQELRITLRRGNGVNNSLGVAILGGAEDTNVRAAVLSEGYFIDVPNIPNRRDWSTRYGQALGRGILQWLRENP